MPCSAWPNSWNSVFASSSDSSAGSPFGRLGEVHDVVDDRRRAAGPACSRTAARSSRRRSASRAGRNSRRGTAPRCAAVGVARPRRRAHRDARPRMPVSSSKVRPNSRVGDVEAGVDDAVELQIGLQFGLVEGDISRRAASPGRSASPSRRSSRCCRRPRRCAAARPRRRAAFSRALSQTGSSRPMHGVRRLGHGVVELQRGVAAIAEQLRLLGAQRQHLAHDRRDCRWRRHSRRAW